MKTLIFVLSFCLFTTGLFSQSRKKIRELNIESITEIEEDYEDSNGKETVKFVTVYDARGNVIKEMDYDKSGKLDEIITYEYNVDDDKTKEVHYNSNNKVLATYIYTYEQGLLTERKEYDDSNKLVSRYTYKYENRLRTERNEYDESNRLLERKKYIYKYRNN
jgi:hypothetical protein